MKNLTKLNLNELKVESFITTLDVIDAKTVKGGGETGTIDTGGGGSSGITVGQQTWPVAGADIVVKVGGLKVEKYILGLKIDITK